MSSGSDFSSSLKVFVSGISWGGLAKTHDLVEVGAAMIGGSSNRDWNEKLFGNEYVQLPVSFEYDVQRIVYLYFYLSNTETGPW